MAGRKPNYYRIDNLRSTHAQYMMLLGQRANGKSYQVKNECALRDAWDYINNRKETTRYCAKGKNRKVGKFIYLRRWQADIKMKAVTEYFEDGIVEKITDGEYTKVMAYNGSIYFAKEDEEKGIIKSAEIGRYCALNEYERYKSRVYKDFVNIIYEEFITDAIYLDDEPTLLQQFVSTVLRNEEGTVFLIGNTLSRVCPYFSEWCLDGVLKQKLGTIEIYHFHVEDTTIDIAVEYCANANAENKMFFGQTAKQIVSGEWDTQDVPKLPKKQTDYEKIFELLVEYQSFKFVVELLVEPFSGGVLCFVYPFTGRRKFLRVLSDKFSDSPYVSARLDISKRPEYLISECFRRGKVCYSDNLTGADFKHVNEKFKIGNLI